MKVEIGDVFKFKEDFLKTLSEMARDKWGKAEFKVYAYDNDFVYFRYFCPIDEVQKESSELIKRADLFYYRYKRKKEVTNEYDWLDAIQENFKEGI